MKLNLKRVSTAGMLLAVLSLTACGTPKAQDGAEPGICRPDAAAALADKARISDAEARQMTGASLVRQVQPGQGVTMDFRRERVTIETSSSTGNIVRAYCG